MDGSIADSTALRMRTQLQRMHHATSNSQADGFLEELLRLPATSVPEEAEPSADIASELDNSSTDTSGQAAGALPADDDRPKEDSESSSEESFETPCLPLCYAPMTVDNAQPQAVEPSSDAIAETTVHADATPVQPAIVSDTVPDESAAPAVVEVVEQAETPLVTATASEPVQPVEANAKEVVKTRDPKPLRESPRTREARDKVETKADRAQPEHAQLESPTAHAEPVREKEVAQRPVDTQEKVQAVESTGRRDDQQPVDNQRHGARDDRDDRGKWYETSTNDKVQDRASSLVERMQEALAAQDNASDDTSLQSEPTQNMAELVASASENLTALPEATLPLPADAMALANDVAMAAQADLSRASDAQRVTETASGSGVDSGGRGRTTNPTGTMATSAASAQRGAASSTATSGSSASTASSSDGSTPITQQERVRLVQRVARSFSRLGPDGGQVTLKLHPPQLGVLNVSIKIEGQTMTARLQTETSAARDAIIESLPILRDRLSEQGIEIEKFQVEVGQQEDLASGGGQAGMFSGGGTDSQQNETAASAEFDYRRSGRNQHARHNVGASSIVEPKLQGWSVADRSLDVRA